MDLKRMKDDLQHKHGGRPEQDFDRLSVQSGPVIDFSINLNPLGFPEIIRRHWEEMMADIYQYPNLEGEGIMEFICRRLGIPKKNILPGNGSTEIIYLLPRALGLKKILIIAPSYHDYLRSTILAGAEPIIRSLSSSDAFQPLSFEEFSAALRKADAVWLGNPNNPTGTLWDRGVLLEAAELYPEKWVIVDEAFMPFVPGWEDKTLALSPIPSNVIVIHSLTKFYGLAGLRLGGVTASEEVIEMLRYIKEPWTINSVADSVAPLLLECGDYEAETRTLVKEERERLYVILSGMEALEVFPSHANFMLLRWKKGDDLDAVLRGLLLRGIYVRDCRNFSGLESDYFRVAVRSPRENDVLLGSLSAVSRE
jgi:threonine-phosphate decarboxylase